jgi:hypothetical protein
MPESDGIGFCSALPDVGSLRDDAVELREWGDELSTLSINAPTFTLTDWWVVASSWERRSDAHVKARSRRSAGSGCKESRF